MKKTLTFLLFSITGCLILNSQTISSQGKPFAEIFTDFHYHIDDTSKTTGFGLNRAFLGYNYTPEGNFSALIIVNVGSPEDLAPGAEPKRYAYFREASVTYNKNKLSLSFGMVSTRYEDFQQTFWGKRYLAPEYQSLYGYGWVADLGVVADFKFNDIIQVDFSVLNGKGYTNVQFDNSLKTAIGLTITTPDKLAFRLYCDIMRPSGIWQSTMIAFAGLKNDLFSFGAEASYKTNLDLGQGHDVWGLSATGSIFLNPKSEIFGRCDYSTSRKVLGDALPWDCEKDATYIIGGIQRTFNDNVKMALNYRLTDPHSPGGKNTNSIYLNARFRF
jgi:hypothetical protein